MVEKYDLRYILGYWFYDWFLDIFMNMVIELDYIIIVERVVVL